MHFNYEKQIPFEQRFYKMINIEKKIKIVIKFILQLRERELLAMMVCFSYLIKKQNLK
jgi:hypothetical protein